MARARLTPRGQGQLEVSVLQAIISHQYQLDRCHAHTDAAPKMASLSHSFMTPACVGSREVRGANLQRSLRFWCFLVLQLYGLW